MDCNTPDHEVVEFHSSTMSILDKVRGDKSRANWLARAILTARNKQRQDLESGPHLLVKMTKEELAAVQRLARKCKTSPARLGQVAIQQLLVAAAAGAAPMIAPGTLENALTGSKPFHTMFE